MKDALSLHSVASKANIHQSSKGGVLVASDRGVCRGPAVVIAYLMNARMIRTRKVAAKTKTGRGRRMA